MRLPTEPRYLHTVDAATWLGLSPRTLEKYRCLGGGPIFHKFGGRVMYALPDLQKWIDQSACRSTSDPNYDRARLVGRMHG